MLQNLDWVSAARAVGKGRHSLVRPALGSLHRLSAKYGTAPLRGKGGLHNAVVGTQRVQGVARSVRRWGETARCSFSAATDDYDPGRQYFSAEQLKELDAMAAAGKKVCDPFEQNGQPLEHETVRDMMRNLHASWAYDEEKRELTRTFVCHNNKRGKTFTGHTGVGAFALVQSLGNLCVNGGHAPYSVTVIPRKDQVVACLKTIQVRGVSHSDCMLAFELDAVHEGMMRKLL